MGYRKADRSEESCSGDSLDSAKQEIETLIDKLEDDNDVQKVFHNMAF